jgi:cytochrome c553
MTDSVAGAPLNGGGFTTAANNWNWETSAIPSYLAITSSHSMETTSVLWGAGNGADTSMYLTCASCHDPHGSSNYRLLKDQVNGVKVGGYNALGDADAFVFSAETNYPSPMNGGTGFNKGDSGAAQVAAYVPDYTGGTKVLSATSGKSLSAWCSACHTGYNNQSDYVAGVAQTKDYGSYESTVGAQVRHRHPVDIPLNAGNAVLAIPVTGSTVDPRIPLELHYIAGAVDTDQSNVGCLTCHLAHGSSQKMTGWAASSYQAGSWMPVKDNIPGVNPDKVNEPGLIGTSALLRADNRGVCERCHKK